MKVQGPEFSIVMPVFNEQEIVAATVESLIQLLAQEKEFEVILVDDGSSDGTWHTIGALSSKYPQVKGVRFSRNFGHQSALNAGLSESTGSAVITMDSDGEHPVSLVPTLLEKWRAGAKVVQTIRADSKNISFFKRFTSKSFYRLFSWLAETKIEPGSADFRLLDRSVVNLMAAHPSASQFIRGFVPWTGFTTETVGFVQGKRAAGESKFTSAKMIGLARQGILGFSLKPLRMSMVLGTTTCLFAIFHLIYTLVIKIAFPSEAVPGWASMAALLSLLGGVQLLVIGILGEYVGLLFETVRNQPTFIVEDRCGFDPLEKT